MPALPPSVLSLGSNSLASPHSLPSWSDLSRHDIPVLNDPPNRGFFGTLFLALSSIVVVGSTLSTITSVWKWIHHQHQKNTAQAQHEVDFEHIQYHNEEWKHKQRIASFQACAVLAHDNPIAFIQLLVVENPSRVDRAAMAGLLKRVNPEFYEKIQEYKVETMDWEDAKNYLVPPRSYDDEEYDEDDE
jgi:hypothetical protein